MKNTIKLLMCAVMALCFASCTPEEDASSTDILFALSVRENSIAVTWNAVPEAVFYELQLDNNDVVRTDKTTHIFEDLEYNAKYTVNLKAIALTGDILKESTRSTTIGKRVIPAYREWVTEIPTTAISDNGLWAVGAFGMDGVIINLSNDKITITPNVAFYDVDNNGVAVGSYQGEVQSGVAAMYIDGEIFEVDLSSITANNTMSSLTSITPDGSYAVGWYACSEDDVYYNIYGMYAPFCYDVVNNTVSIPEPWPHTFYSVNSHTPHAVAPDRSILGFEQSYVGDGLNIAINTIWEDEYTQYEYVNFTYDEQSNPITAMGGKDNLFSPSGRYVYGNTSYYTDEYISYPAVYDRETNQMYKFDCTGSVTSITDDGIVFINDSIYGSGTTTYVTTLTNNDPSTFQTLEAWLLYEYGIDVSLYNSQNDTDPDNAYTLDGVMVLGVSDDGKTLMTTTSSMYGWVNSVIYLDGTK